MAIEAKFNRGGWLDLALMTNTMDEVKGHGRLLRSLEWGDADYRGHIIEIVPVILGARHGRPLRSSAEAGDVFPNLA